MAPYLHKTIVKIMPVLCSRMACLKYSNYLLYFVMILVVASATIYLELSLDYANEVI